MIQMIPIFLFLLAISAMCSGLTIGMFSLGIAGLEQKVKLGNEKAVKVLQIRKQGNYLLCTLLLTNAAVNSGIAIVSTYLSTGSGIVAGLISTAAIFLFGEVLPQASFSRYALEVGYYSRWLVKSMMFIMWPIAKPISMILDFILGKEFPERFEKNELAVLIESHQESNQIDEDEKRIILGAMKFSEKRSKDVMTPATVIFYLDESVIINDSLLQKIRDEHYSRIPVVSGSRDEVVGILIAKDLIGYDVSQKKSVGDLAHKKIIAVKSSMHLDALLNHMIKNKSHLSFIYDDFGTLLGVVSLEDIMEEIIDKEILDEADTVADLQALARKEQSTQLEGDIYR